MRVLYLCHRIPCPPNKGDKIRAFHQVKAISARHEVDLFTLADDPADLAHQSMLRAYCRRLVVARLDRRRSQLRALPFLFTRKPLTLPYFYSDELKREVRNAIRERSYDRVFVYCSAMAQYVEGFGGIPVVTDFVDVDSDKWHQYSTFTRWPFSAVYRREGRALREYERRAGESSTCVLVTTEREARLARQLSEKMRVQVIPNGIDCEHFKPSQTASLSAVPTIGFVGDMSYFPNQEAVTNFARTVFPLVRRQVPGARFVIVGRSPSRGVQKLKEIEGIEVTGFVADVRDWLAQMHVSVAPFSIAAGIQNKILEAMAYGLPVVATSRAAQGFSDETSSVLDLADRAEEMAEKIVCLLQDPRLARRRGIEGRHKVASEYNWSRSLDRLLQVIEDLPGADVPRVVAGSATAEIRDLTGGASSLD